MKLCRAFTPYCLLYDTQDWKQFIFLVYVKGFANINEWGENFLQNVSIQYKITLHNMRQFRNLNLNTKECDEHFFR